MYNSTSIVGSAILWIDDPPQVKGKIKYQKVTTLSLLPGQVTGKSSTAASSACQDLLNIWDEEQAKSFLFMLFFFATMMLKWLSEHKSAYTFSLLQSLCCSTSLMFLTLSSFLVCLQLQCQWLTSTTAFTVL